MIFGAATERWCACCDDGDTSTVSLDGDTSENWLIWVVTFSCMSKSIVSSVAVDWWALVESEGIPELIIAKARFLFVFESKLNFGLIETKCFEH